LYKKKKYIRSFRDLEVYQKTEKASVDVIKKVLFLLKETQTPLKEKIVEVSLSIPYKIALAHSKRFDNKEEAIMLIEEAKNDCAGLIVYLEQIRDIYIDESDRVILNEIIKQYSFSRRKIVNLLRAWKRYEEEKK